ncbi:MAG: hypothetical protein V7642_1767 [Burkholderiales bacterium]|jgi:hypothetical protein
MNTSRTSPAIRGRAPDVTDFGEIQSIPEGPIEPKLRSQLKELEEQLSIPQSELPRRVSTALNTALGLRLTVDNPVWAGDPIPVLRALQRKLVEYSLMLEAEDRSECMMSISLVERAVRLRLRWLQMRRSDAERDFIVKQEGPGNEEESKRRRNPG